MDSVCLLLFILAGQGESIQLRPNENKLALEKSSRQTWAC